VVQLLIDAGANVAAEDSTGSTPLHLAGEMGRSAEVLRVLIAAGADVAAKDNSGWTPLHFAAEKGRVAAAQVLINAGAEKEAVESYGKTPLHLAAEKGREGVARLLIDAGANATAKNDAGRTPLDLAEKHPNVAENLRVHVAKRRCVAFAMGGHARLGEASPALGLDADLVRMVLSRAVPRALPNPAAAEQ